LFKSASKFKCFVKIRQFSSGASYPGGSTAGGAAAHSAAITGVYTAASISGSIKTKDEFTLEYKLEATDGTQPEVANTAKAKAKSDGEDVLTPLVEKSAQAIIDSVMKK